MLDLIAQFNAEFGKQPKAAKTARPVEKKQEIWSDSNRIAQLSLDSSPWAARSRIYYFIEQTCQCCGNTTETVGNILIRHEHKRNGSVWDCQMPDDMRYSHLPKEMRSIQQSVAQCPTCIRAEFSVCDLPRERSVQLDLLQ